MPKRQLTDNEKGISERMIKKFEKEMLHLRFLERFYDLMLGEGCYFNYLEKLKENRDKKRTVCEDIQEAEFKIRELKKQVLEGVEVKEAVGVG